MANWQWVTRLHRAFYEGSGGRIGARLMGIEMCLLTTTGRKSGTSRTLPLACFTDPEHPRNLLIVASNHGQDQHPAWLLNLRALPEARVRLGRKVFDARATEPEQGEYERLWPWLAERNPPYAHYQKKTARRIPIVVLEP